MFQPLAYPMTPHVRRHGPMGYTDYRSFKPWLRDEFAFRCVFCLARERWSPLGATSFGVEHVNPRSLAPQLEWAYDNLLYACSVCNSYKQDQRLPLDPCEEAYGLHVRIGADGVAEALTRAGKGLIKLLELNRAELLRYRQEMLWLVASADWEPKGDVAVYLRSKMAYPDDLPDLASLSPPGGNTRPDGAQACYFALRQRSELPATY